MKRRDLVKHLEEHGCELFREGGRHSVFINRTAGKSATVPCHRKVNKYLALRICKDLDVPLP